MARDLGGGYVTRLSADPDSARAYRARVARAFLPYGVTLVRDVGSATCDLPLLRAWTTRAPGFPDLLPSGAQLVSPDFDGDPLAPPRELLGGKVVIKDGAAWAPPR